jgi:hypothetical protein
MRVLANATLDVIEEPNHSKDGTFKVRVWGQPPHDKTRTYEITAKTDTMAAQQGINRFVEEMETLSIQGTDK